MRPSHAQGLRATRAARSLMRAQKDAHPNSQEKGYTRALGCTQNLTRARNLAHARLGMCAPWSARAMVHTGLRLYMCPRLRLVPTVPQHGTDTGCRRLRHGSNRAPMRFRHMAPTRLARSSDAALMRVARGSDGSLHTLPRCSNVVRTHLQRDLYIAASHAALFRIFF